MDRNPPNIGISLESPSDLLAIFFRHKKKAILVPLLIMAVGTMVLLFAPREYQSEAKIYLQVGRESVKLDPTATTMDRISIMSNDRANEINTAVDVLKSRGLMAKVVDKVGAEVVLNGLKTEQQEPNAVIAAIQNGVGTVVDLVKSIDPVSPAEAALVRIEKNLSVDVELDSTLIAIRLQAKSPQLAQLLTKTLLDIYQQEHLRMHRTSGSKEFFAEQYESLQTQLDDSVKGLQQAKNRLNMVSIASRRDTLESRLSSLEQNRNSNSEKLAGARARVADFKKQIAAIPERMVSEELTVPDTGTDTLREKVYALEVQMLDQQVKYSDDHPALQATREQLKQARNVLDQESTERHQQTSDVNPNFRSLKLSLAEAESELAALEAQRVELSTLLGRVHRELKDLNNSELEMDRLERKSQLARTNFFRYAENLEKARIDQELDNQRISNVIISQEALLAEKPISPNKVVVGLLSLVLAGASALSLVLVSEKFNDRIYKVEQLEQSLQLPVLGAIPAGREYVRVTA